MGRGVSDARVGEHFVDGVVGAEKVQVVEGDDVLCCFGDFLLLFAIRFFIGACWVSVGICEGCSAFLVFFVSQLEDSLNVL